MGLFRRKKPKQTVGDRDVTVDEKLVASIKEAMNPPIPKRRKHLFVDARAELARIDAEERKRRQI